MTRRKNLDPAAMGFIKGEEPPTPDEKPIPSQQPSTKKSTFMSQLLEAKTEKEATTRITVDLPKSMHQKLSILSATSGVTKADIIRGLLAEALQELSD